MKNNIPVLAPTPPALSHGFGGDTVAMLSDMASFASATYSTFAALIGGLFMAMVEMGCNDCGRRICLMLPR